MYFITIPTEKAQFKKRLIEAGADDSGWVRFYYDKDSKDSAIEWMEYFPYQDDKAPSILKRTDLPEQLKEMMNRCFLSADIEDWRGLGAELSSGKYKINDIAQLLKENAAQWPDRALKEFKKSLRLIENRPIVGMKVEEVERSYQEFIHSKKEIDRIIQ